MTILIVGVGKYTSISSLFEENNISIEKMIQKPLENNNSNLLLATHISLEKDISNALSALKQTSEVKSTPSMIRIED